MRETPRLIVVELTTERELTIETKKHQFRVGVVKFFNARPLIYGLEKNQSIKLVPDVPSKLAEGLDSGDFDAALVPTIDYQRSKSEEAWQVFPDYCISSNHVVVTVRVFSKVAPDTISTLACDTDSHTSVALARVLWQKKFGKTLEVMPLGERENAEAVLLIGDKVMAELGKWEHELDLGLTWTEMTSLPFVYAFWAASKGEHREELREALKSAGEKGTVAVDEIVDKYASLHGFTKESGTHYFTENIRFPFGEDEKKGVELFYALSEECGVIEQNRPINWL